MGIYRYYYWCTQRPACPGAIPRGVVSIHNLDKDDIIPELGKGAYAKIEYDRKLTEQEKREYELTPVVYTTSTVNGVNSNAE